MIVDTHSHLSFKAYDADRDDVIQRTRKEGVVCIDVGTKYETSKRAIELAEKNDGIYAAIGMHPIHINPVRNSPPQSPSGRASAGAISNGVKTDLLKLKMDEEEGAFEPLGEEYDKEKYRELAKSPKVVAIGEIGLDYYYKPKIPTAKPSRIHDTDKVGIGTKLEQFKEKQKEVFKAQLDLAKELNLPVIIHCRMAHEDLLEILNYKLQTTHYKLTGVIHCFTGSREQAQKYMDLGFYLGINGIIFKMDLDEVIKNAPLDKILIETDCPYLTPPSARRSPEGDGGRNEPIFVKHVIQKIADLKGMSFDEVAEATTANAIKLFKFGQSR